MKNLKKLCIFAILVLVVSMLFSVCAFAAAEPAGGIDATTETTEQTDASNKIPMDKKPETFSERLELALQGSATGMVMVFAVLGLLCVILYISKYFFYDIPRKKREGEAQTRENAHKTQAVKAPAAPKPEAVAFPAAAPIGAVAPASDDGEIVAVITAAIAAMIESGDYKNEFVGGFRVVSFKRSTQSAWNRK